MDKWTRFFCCVCVCVGGEEYTRIGDQIGCKWLALTPQTIKSSQIQIKTKINLPNTILKAFKFKNSNTRMESCHIP